MIFSERLVLEGKCLSSCYGSSFEWRIYKQNSRLTNIENMLTTPISSAKFVLLPDLFQEKINYTVTYTARRDSGAFQEVSYHVVVNELPRGGIVICIRYCFPPLFQSFITWKHKSVNNTLLAWNRFGRSAHASLFAFKQPNRSFLTTLCTYNILD